MTERQKYEVEQVHNGFELRRYEPCTIAEVTVSEDYQSAASKAFRHLFNYISKGNAESKSIAMTAPVIASTMSTMESQDWKISFVMPAGATLKDLPNPNEERVVLRQLPAQNCVALSFRGRATKGLCERKEESLRLLAKNEHFKLSSETRIARFDPPFKPGLLMYNEIVIPLTSD
jgi:hypothetical protein